MREFVLDKGRHREGILYRRGLGRVEGGKSSVYPCIKSVLAGENRCLDVPTY